MRAVGRRRRSARRRPAPHPPPTPHLHTTTSPHHTSPRAAYTDPDFTRFNASGNNALSTRTETANGYWWRRVAINNVGAHAVRLTCGADVRMATWTVHKPAPRRTAKNVILFIGDGLNTPIVTSSRYVSRGMTGGYPNEKLHMQTMDRVGTMSTSGIDSIITDSANSAYAYASGHKTNMNALGG